MQPLRNGGLNPYESSCVRDKRSSTHWHRIKPTDLDIPMLTSGNLTKLLNITIFKSWNYEYFPQIDTSLEVTYHRLPVRHVDNKWRFFIAIQPPKTIQKSIFLHIPTQIEELRSYLFGVPITTQLCYLWDSIGMFLGLGKKRYVAVMLTRTSYCCCTSITFFHTVIVTVDLKITHIFWTIQWIPSGND